MFDTNKIKILVKAGATKNEVLGFDIDRGAYRVNIKSPAQNNKANIEIIKFFTKLTKKKVRILSGKTSKLKTLLLE